MDALLFLYSLASRAYGRFRNLVYRAGWKRPARSPLPVISVGNIVLGGSGKTPLVMELLASLSAGGRKPAVVTRGYRGAWEKKGGVLSDGKARHGSWREGGDEPFLIARTFPDAGVYVGRDRLTSCRRAAADGFDVVVLDDGFQRRGLARDLDIVLHDPSARSVLRESPAALGRADCVLIGKRADDKARRRTLRWAAGKPVLEYEVVPRALVDLRTGRESPPAALAGRRVLAFCGLARPTRFRSLLERLGIEIVAFLSFSDHHVYPPASRRKIEAASAGSGAEAAVTTAKDAVKLESGPAVLEGRPLYYLRIGLELDSRLLDLVAGALARSAP
ncbi:MAG: tetraacyldisaccharide 4'-kinase [Candidatus Aminicenantes bacterium]|nr:tetraacyldisaccharide 4'-kinase [Candidatus Aminicenantes bacterium]